MGRTILKVGVALILVALIWKLVLGKEDHDDIDRID